MNGFKNFVIFALSLIILFESALLVYFMRKARGAAPMTKPSVSEQVSAPSVERPVMPKAPPEVSPRAEVSERPRIILGRIVLVLDDWGYNLRNRDFIVDNDFHVTISILPFRPYSSQIAKLAADKNKSVIVHMPMEPHNKENYGLEENTLMTSMDKKDVIRLLDAALASVPYACGLNNHMGSKATEDARLMKVVIGYLKSKNMIFLDSLVTPATVCRDVAGSYGVRYAARDVFLDNDNDPAAIRQQMLKLAQRARAAGCAFGIGHDRPATIAVLREMIPKLEQEGYRFETLSECSF